MTPDQVVLTVAAAWLLALAAAAFAAIRWLIPKK